MFLPNKALAKATTRGSGSSNIKLKEITEIVEKDDTRTNKKSSVLSLVTQRLENRCLMAMSDFFNDNNFKIGVYCFDGLMIEKDKKNRITNDILDECCLFVEKCTGYKIKLDIKPMDEGITLPELVGPGQK